MELLPKETINGIVDYLVVYDINALTRVSKNYNEMVGDINDYNIYIITKKYGSLNYDIKTIQSLDSPIQLKFFWNQLTSLNIPVTLTNLKFCSGVMDSASEV